MFNSIMQHKIPGRCSQAWHIIMNSVSALTGVQSILGTFHVLFESLTRKTQTLCISLLITFYSTIKSANHSPIKSDPGPVNDTGDWLTPAAHYCISKLSTLLTAGVESDRHDLRHVLNTFTQNYLWLHEIICCTV